MVGVVDVGLRQLVVYMLSLPYLFYLWHTILPTAGLRHFATAISHLFRCFSWCEGYNLIWLVTYEAPYER